MRRLWTNEEMVYLIQNYLVYDDEELGKIMNRTANSISGKMDGLSLYRNNSNPSITFIINCLERKHKGLMERCYDYDRKDYAGYGGRGIEVCDEWQMFINFYGWSIKNGYRIGYHLHRKDDNGDYSPDNCIYVSEYKHRLIHNPTAITHETIYLVLILFYLHKMNVNKISKTHNIDKKMVEGIVKGVKFKKCYETFRRYAYILNSDTYYRFDSDNMITALQHLEFGEKINSSEGWVAEAALAGF